MNLHLLRTFASVVEQGGFTRAAQTIHVSQPAVSRAVRELEEQLGLALLERASGPLRCTVAGNALYRHAKGIFALEQAAESDLRGLRGLEAGNLVVGAGRSIATYILPKLLARFLERFADIDVRIVSDNTDAIEQQLLACEIDVALVESPTNDPRIELLDWRDDELVILASARHDFAARDPIDPALLGKMRWVMREAGSGMREVAQKLLRELGIDVHRVLEVSSNGAVVQFVAAGLGVTMISLEVARDQIGLGRVMTIAIEGFRPRRRLYRARLRDRPMSPAAHAFDAMAASEGLRTGTDERPGA